MSDTDPHSADNRSKTLLLVDDEVTLLNIVDHMVKHFGYTSLMAENGNDALALYEERHADIDLVLLDRQLPDFDGFEIAARIQQINPKCPVVLMTGYSDLQVSEIRQDTNIVSLLKKPYRMADLQELLENLLTPQSESA